MMTKISVEIGILSLTGGPLGSIWAASTSIPCENIANSYMYVVPYLLLTVVYPSNDTKQPKWKDRFGAVFMHMRVTTG